MVLPETSPSRDFDPLRSNLADGVQRTKKFIIGSSLYEDGQLYAIPWLPPKELFFHLFFFRTLFQHLQRKTMREVVPLAALRNMSFLMMQAFQLEGCFDVNFFGSLEHDCTWDDLRNALTQDGYPRIAFSIAERIFITMEDSDSSKLAKIWFYFIMVTTVVNLVELTYPHRAADWMCGFEGPSGEFICNNLVKTTCMIVFSFEYLTKLMLAPFVRAEISDSNKVLGPDALGQLPVPRSQRLLEFMMQPWNVLDFCAIFPWWLTLLFGSAMPSTSFLRMLRLSRLFRIFKTARYFDLLQVLGLTLWKSVTMVLMLFVLISLIGLAVGILLTQMEGDQGSEAFSSVPSAFYWVFARLISMKDTPHIEGKVTSWSGIVLLAVTMALKGVLWIVPIARIKQIFQQEYDEVKRVGDMHSVMVEELLCHSRGEDKRLVGGPMGCTVARVMLSGCQENLQVFVPLPILNASFICMREMELSLRSGDAALIVDIEWQPSEAMVRTGKQPQKALLPSGKLTLAVTGSRSLPTNVTGLTWEVPVSTFGKASKKVLFNAGSYHGSSCDFDVCWEADISRPGMQNSNDRDSGDKESYQKTVLVLLYEQHRMMQNQQQLLQEVHEQGGLLEKQHRLLEEQSRRLEFLEAEVRKKK
eukprot:TRINITY_DN28094_c0_g1_i1.p1 TRINITY_DN28094_c0_g1~~TRINITY_DN28094_c0_g1_i1.p1  ORF type:complete len:659 (+),score=119.88 TRINITY_DN28094_c0_g1_i1:54-1979(+)